jgi:hypothetical protein
MAEGTRFGRKPKLTKRQVREAYKRVAAGEPLREIALSYAVDLDDQPPESAPRSRGLTTTGAGKVGRIDLAEVPGRFLRRIEVAKAVPPP